MATAHTNGKKSASKSAPGVPFTGKGDPRSGRGPAKGAPNAGRPPDWLRAEMARGRTICVKKLVTMADKEIPDLDPDQMLKLVKDWAPPDEQQGGAVLTVRFVAE